MTRIDMMDSMIHEWGFEHPCTISFFAWCEENPFIKDEVTEIAYNMAYKTALKIMEMDE